MELIILLIKQYWKEVLITLVISFAIGYVVNLNNENEKLTNKVSKLTSELKIEKDNVTTLKGSIVLQNTEINRFKTEAVVRQAKAADDLKIAQKSRNKNEQTANLILVKEPTSTDPCKAAENLLNEYIK